MVREDLLGRLPDANDDNRLLILAAPGGWGKTTLLDTWDTWRTDTAFCRCPLTRGDNDPTRFINTLVGAASPLLGDIDRTWSDPSESTPTVWVEDSLPLFLKSIETTPTPVVLVLDDYHVIDNADTHSIVQSLVETTGPQTLTVLSTRIDPPLRLGRLRAARTVAEVRSEDLRFSVDQTDQLLRNTFDLDLTQDQVKLLVDTTEGWPAAISLAAQSLQTVNDPQEFLTRFVSTDRLIVDYLAEELLDTLPLGHQSFLHDTSVVERFVPTLAAALTEADDAGQIGEDLERRGLLRRSYDSDRVWYRYHQLLRDVLHQRLNPETQRARHLTAADWFLAENQPRAAIEQLIAGGANERAIDLISQHASDYTLRGRSATVADWIEAVADTPAASPSLYLLGAQASVYSGRVDQGQAWLDRAANAGPLQPTEQLLALAMQISLAHADGRVADAAAIGDRLIDYHQAHAGGLTGEPEEVAECIFLAGLQFSMIGETEQAEPLYEQVISIAAEGQNQSPTIAALGVKALHAYLDGNLGDATSLTERAFELAKSMNLPAAAIHMYIAHLGRVLTGSEQQAREAIDALRKINEYVYSPYGVVFSHLSEAHFWLGTGGEPDAAERALVAGRDLLDELLQPSPLAEEYYKLISSRLPGVADSSDQAPGVEALTDREIQVLRAFSSNLTQREIGRELFLSFNTIKTYARSAYRKLGVGSRTEAVRVCREAGLF